VTQVRRKRSDIFDVVKLSWVDAIAIRFRIRIKSDTIHRCLGFVFALARLLWFGDMVLSPWDSVGPRQKALIAGCRVGVKPVWLGKVFTMRKDTVP